MIRCEINGIEYRLTTKLRIIEHIGNNTKTTIQVKVDDQDIPKAYDVVEIFDDADPGNKIFVGVCGSPKSPVYNSINDVKIYTLDCRNINNILAKRLVNYAEEGKNITQVVTEIFNQFISTEGISLGQIDDFSNITLERYVVPNLPLNDVLTELANVSSAIWNVGNDKVFNFIKKETFNVFDRQITALFSPFANFGHKTTDVDVRTVQIITGGTQVTSEQTERFVYDGNNNSFNTVFPLIQKPSINVNNVAVDPSRIGINGIDNDNSEVYFLFSNRSNTVNYKSESNFLSTNDDVDIIYFGEFATRVRASNSEAIERISSKTGFSGLIENVTDNPTLESINDANLFANSLLENFDSERGEIKVKVTNTKLRRLGYNLDNFSISTIFDFNIPEIGIVGEFVITEREIEPLIIDNAIDNLQAVVKLKDRNFMRSYGQDIKSLTSGVRNLSIRQDEIIIQNINSEEVIEFTETTQFAFNNAIYPVASSTDSNLYDPMTSGDLGGAYPV